jgi:hypothetical protein
MCFLELLFPITAAARLRPDFHSLNNVEIDAGRFQAHTCASWALGINSFRPGAEAAINPAHRTKFMLKTKPPVNVRKNLLLALVKSLLIPLLLLAFG